MKIRRVFNFRFNLVLLMEGQLPRLQFAAKRKRRRCTGDFFAPPVKLLRGYAKQSAGLINTGNISDFFNEFQNTFFVFFPDSLSPAYGGNNGFIEIDNFQNGFVEFYERLNIGNILEYVDVCRKRIMALSAIQAVMRNRFREHVPRKE
jgi:hypothetical protein